MPKRSAVARRALAEERRGQILAAATKVFAQKGFDGATIADIAQEAGLAEGSIYNYFKNKGDLLVSIPQVLISPALADFQERVTAETASSPGDPRQVLSRMAANMVAVFRSNPEMIRVMLSTLPTMSAATRRKYVDQVVLYALRMLQGYIQQQMDTGVFRKDLNPAIVARAMPGMLFLSVLMQEVMEVGRADRFDYDELVATAVALLTDGLLPRPREKK